MSLTNDAEKENTEERGFNRQVILTCSNQPG